MGDQRSDQPASQPPPTHRTTATHTHPEPASPPAPVNPNLLQTATKQKQEIGSNLKENLPQTATSMQRNSWPRPQPRPQPRPGPKPRPASVKPWPRPGPKPRPASVKPWLLFPRTYVRNQRIFVYACSARRRHSRRRHSCWLGHFTGQTHPLRRQVGSHVPHWQPYVRRA